MTANAYPLSETPRLRMFKEGVVTQLLVAHKNGDEGAVDELFKLVYDQLKEIASRELFRRNPGETMNPTGLVHEAYLKLFDREETDWENRAHFFAVTSRAMRQILVDYARKWKAQKRGGPEARHGSTQIDASRIAGENVPSVDILDLDHALNRLEELNPRFARIVECRYFANMSVKETAEVLDVAERTVNRDWIKAKSLLYMMFMENEI